MSGYRLEIIGGAEAVVRARGLTLRRDMRTQFDEEAGAIPAGPVWVFSDGPRTLGLGGLRRHGAGASVAWLLVAEGVTLRDWVAARRAIRDVLNWAATRSIRRVHACPEASMAGAQRLLVRLGFEPSGREGEHIVMTKELV